MEADQLQLVMESSVTEFEKRRALSTLLPSLVGVFYHSNNGYNE